MSSDSAFYEQALREADDGSVVQELWAKAFSDADGDHDRAKARYIKLRVAELMLGGGGSAGGKTSARDDSMLAWPRLWARQIDFALCVAITLGLAVLIGATLLTPSANIFLQLAVGSLLSALVLIGYETLSLTAFGTTVGKAVLGLRVETRSGAKIEFGRALRRSLGVWWRGCYFYLFFPVTTMIAWWLARRRLRKTGSTPWDDSCVTRVAGGPVPLWRATLAGVIAMTAFTFVIGFDAAGRKEVSKEMSAAILGSHGVSTVVDKPAPNNPYSDPNLGANLVRPNHAAAPSAAAAVEGRMLAAGIPANPTIDQVGQWATGRYPIMDSNSPKSDKRVIEAVIGWRDRFILDVHEADPAALFQAVEYVMSRLNEDGRVCYPHPGSTVYFENGDPNLLHLLANCLPNRAESKGATQPSSAMRQVEPTNASGAESRRTPREQQAQDDERQRRVHNQAREFLGNVPSFAGGR